MARSPLNPHRHKPKAARDRLTYKVTTYVTEAAGKMLQAAAAGNDAAHVRRLIYIDLGLLVESKPPKE